MIDAAHMLSAYDQQMRGWIPAAPPRGFDYQQVGPLVRIVGQQRGFIDPPVDTGLRGRDLDELIAQQRDFFAARGEAVEWKVRAHDQPIDLPQRLLAAGFIPEDTETVVIGASEQMATDPVLPSGVTLREVAERVDFERIAAMESQVWNADWSWLAEDLLTRVTAAPEDVRVLVAEAEGQVVSAAWLVVKPGTGFAGLWGGSTVSQWRGRGIYRALVARRAQLALQRGVRYLQVDASDDSKPILVRLGFVEVTATTPYVWNP
ncbi:GNAT family N-acetyltransferase [Kineococcus arenarius]|uniref:GNAT family N-acetyltransferase n=1 Tax=unclassified Kineococcus TaxID=2621656 RepID=UPI003D7DE700